MNSYDSTAAGNCLAQSKTVNVARCYWMFASATESCCCTHRVSPFTFTNSAPHLLLDVQVYICVSLNQSLDNLRVPIHSSPDRGRPVLLRDQHTSRGCSLALSDMAGVIGIFTSWQVSSMEMQELLTYCIDVGPQP
jgi:hypothetical protein